MNKPKRLLGPHPLIQLEIFCLSQSHCSNSPLTDWKVKTASHGQFCVSLQWEINEVASINAKATWFSGGHAYIS